MESRNSPSVGPYMLGSSTIQSKSRVGISKTVQLVLDDSEELKSSSMMVVVEGPGEKHPSPTEEWTGIGDPSFASGLPEMKLE